MELIKGFFYKKYPVLKSRTLKDSKTNYETPIVFKTAGVLNILFVCWSSYGIIQLTDK